MKFYLKMLDTARSGKITTMAQLSSMVESAQQAKKTLSDIEGLKFCKELSAAAKKKSDEWAKELLDLASENNIFVLHNVPEIDFDKCTEKDLEDVSIDTLSLPFKICSFEALDGLVSPLKSREKGQPSRCFLVHELSFGKYDFYEYSDGGIIKIAHDNKEDNECYRLLLGLIIRQINISKVGIEKVRQYIKLPKGGVRIRKIVHVANKKEYFKYKDSHGHKIDWTHRWAVRGHWRKIEGLGKDREGNYSVSGATWVLDHVKGPEDKEFVRKTRYQPCVALGVA